MVIPLDCSTKSKTSAIVQDHRQWAKFPSSCRSFCAINLRSCPTAAVAAGQTVTQGWEGTCARTELLRLQSGEKNTHNPLLGLLGLRAGRSAFRSAFCFKVYLIVCFNLFFTFRHRKRFYFIYILIACSPLDTKLSLAKHKNSFHLSFFFSLGRHWSIPSPFFSGPVGVHRAPTARVEWSFAFLSGIPETEKEESYCFHPNDSGKVDSFRSVRPPKRMLYLFALWSRRMCCVKVMRNRLTLIAFACIYTAISSYKHC